MRTLAMSLAVAVAACGGSSSKPATTPTAGPASTERVSADDDGHAAHHHDDTPPGDGDASQAEPPAPTGDDAAAMKARLIAQETAAFEQAKPVFDKFCAGCHVQDGRGAKKKTLEHFDMTRYPFGGHHADEITASIRKTLGIGGGKPTMPKNKPGSVPADQVALIAAWADAFDASHAAGAHEGMGHHHEHGDHDDDHDDGDHHH